MLISDDHIEDGNVPDGFRAAGKCVDRFVEINYQTAKDTIAVMKLVPADVVRYKGQILDIIRNNPPLATIPMYYRDGRDEYLWYSDFYDDITKDVYHQYRTFVAPTTEITSANYAKELAKIDMPYFKELIDLVSLERLCMDYEEKPKQVQEPEKAEDNLPREEQPITEQVNIAPVTESKSESIPQKTKSKQRIAKRSYLPKLNDKQYVILAECVDTIKLFRKRIKVTDLKKLLNGKLPEPLQVTNQKSLVHLFDQLSLHKFMKKSWMSVSGGNKDFISFRTEGNQQRYGRKPHFITMGQLSNSRGKNKKEYIHGFIEIEEMIEQLEKYRDK